MAAMCSPSITTSAAVAPVALTTVPLAMTVVIGGALLGGSAGSTAASSAGAESSTVSSSAVCASARAGSSAEVEGRDLGHRCAEGVDRGLEQLLAEGGVGAGGVADDAGVIEVVRKPPERD